MSELTRRELLKGATALGAAGVVSATMPRTAAAQTTQKRDLVLAQGGDVAKFDPHFSTSSNGRRCIGSTPSLCSGQSMGGCAGS